MFGHLNETEIEQVLTSQLIGHLGCHAEGLTYVVPVSYVYDNHFVYGHAQEGLKLAMMRLNPKVCFQVDTMKDMANWRSVVAWGEFEELLVEADREKAFDKLVGRELPLISSETTHLSSRWPFSSYDKDELGGAYFRIRLDKKTGRYETNAVALVHLNG